MIIYYAKLTNLVYLDWWLTNVCTLGYEDFTKDPSYVKNDTWIQADFNLLLPGWK